VKRIVCIGKRALERVNVPFCESVGMRTVEGGALLVSGNAPGADQAYARGGSTIDPSMVELCLPWPDFEHTQFRPTIIEQPDAGYESCMRGNRIRLAQQATVEHIRIASWMHPHFDRAQRSTKNLLIRNVMLLIAEDGTRSDLVIAWPDRTRDGWGGTGHTMRCARYLDVPVWLAELGRWWMDTETTG
jgi:hypothetical protein